ncbi:carbamoyltransferase HypF [Neobacillus vireti]|uniref:carbamoyltransferase HypF n=1 Tax=Neobacillus vireti TaxID=220686 RepID=UPI002FFDCA93
MCKAVKIAVRGRVQGVGFRPFVFMLADKYKLTGTVQNNMDGVKIRLEGHAFDVESFLRDLKNKAPNLSKINEIVVEETDPQAFTNFSIIPSERLGTSMLVIPVDSAVCDECLNEMNDPNDFRYQYPFINCTQCGPRYTIIEELPYDRPYTSMKSFPMCADCRREYEDPANRRHHAQPIACPKCGPRVCLLSKNKREIDCDNPITAAIELLKRGEILAVKGIGGFHLCCNANNERAVAELRKRKKRQLRPLAVMAASLSIIREIAEVNEGEGEVLRSPESPIVILKKHQHYSLADSVAPGMNTIGVMLPYTPLHHLLLSDSELSCLVMTSANPSGMPILYKDEEAFDYLAEIADYYLMHNREILHPVDDSVVQLNNGKLDFLRRSRGYVPDPHTASEDVTGIVAFGGQQKSTFTIGRNEQIFVGPHIGDLENVETINHYKQELNHLLKWIDIPQTAAVIDAHPDYQVQKLVKEFNFTEVIKVQHHHAHMAACLAEHQVNGKAYGIILDGTGYGLDGNVWGFEILYGDTQEFKRLAHLRYTPLPGGEKCIREPWRNAVAMLISLHGEEGITLAKNIFTDKKAEIDLLKIMIEKKINTVYAGTCGRLFDAVSALCGVTKISSYDGEAAIQLAELADVLSDNEPYSIEIIKQETLIIDFSNTLKEIALDVIAGKGVHHISGRFHETVVQAIINTLLVVILNNPLTNRTVVLSGGSIHNRFLRERITKELGTRDIPVYFPETVPCNDGGLSYGQLVVAAAKRRASECVLECQQK